MLHRVEGFGRLLYQYPDEKNSAAEFREFRV